MGLIAKVEPHVDVAATLMTLMGVEIAAILGRNMLEGETMGVSKLIIDPLHRRRNGSNGLFGSPTLAWSTAVPGILLAAR